MGLLLAFVGLSPKIIVAGDNTCNCKDIEMALNSTGKLISG
jgi:hypothetical protein